MIRFSPISFVLSELIARNRGVPPRKATTDALVGGFLPPVAGVVLVSALAQNQGSRNQTTQSSNPGVQPLGKLALRHNLTKTGIDLHWNATLGAAGYLVARDDAGQVETFRVFAVSKPKFVDNSVNSGNTYTYVVEAIGADGKPFAISEDIKVTKP
jgi:hypothetical protein